MSVTSTLERVCTSQKMLSGHVWLWVMLLWYHRMLGFPVCPCTMTLLALTKFTYTCQDRVINHIHKHIGKAKRLHASPQEKIYITDFRREYGTDVSYPAVLWKPPWRGQKEHWIANQITKQSSIVKYSNQCRITEWRCSLSEAMWSFHLAGTLKPTLNGIHKPFYFSRVTFLWAKRVLNEIWIDFIHWELIGLLIALSNEGLLLFRNTTSTFWGSFLIGTWKLKVKFNLDSISVNLNVDVCFS